MIEAGTMGNNVIIELTDVDSFAHGTLTQLVREILPEFHVIEHDPQDERRTPLDVTAVVLSSVQTVLLIGSTWLALKAERGPRRKIEQSDVAVAALTLIQANGLELPSDVVRSVLIQIDGASANEFEIVLPDYGLTIRLLSDGSGYLMHGWSTSDKTENE